jgi:hypothetical protein
MSDDLRSIAAEMAAELSDHANSGDGAINGFPCSCVAYGEATSDCAECAVSKVHTVLQAYRARTAPKADVTATHDPLLYLAYIIGSAAAGIIEAMGMMSDNARRDVREKPHDYVVVDFAALAMRHGLDHTSLAKLLSLPTEEARP